MRNGCVGLCRVGLGVLNSAARPGVLIGAIDTYVLANVQRVFDVMSGRRGLKSSDFFIGEKLSEGSFGVVYSGVVVPKGLRRKLFLNR